MRRRASLSGLPCAQVPPAIFNFWTCVGIVLSSLPVLAVHWVSAFLASHPVANFRDWRLTHPVHRMQVFTPWGLLSGTFFVFSMIFTLFAIQNLGLSSASGLWCGTAGAPPTTS